MKRSRLSAAADLAHGLGVAALVLGRVALHRPRATSTAERLASLPTRGLPVRRPVTIHWNQHQVPFIEAEDDVDLAVALGLVHAHLRLAQIEVMRRAAFGRVAEMIGPLGVEIDRALLLMDFGRAVPQILADLPDDTRRWAEGFVQGVNHHLAHAPALPDEFALLNMKPEPWTLTDLFTLLRFNSADLSWLVWLRLLPVRGRMAAGEWARLWPRLLAGGAPTGFAPVTGAWGEHALSAATRSGSNSAAVAARRSASGAALIASDPHLPLALPNPWLLAGFKSPSYHAVGLMMPGLPFMPLGRNPWIAWGGTSLHAQSSDLFDVGGTPPGELQERTHTLKVRGARARTLRLRESALGPVVSDGLLLRNRRPTAMRWVGHQPSQELHAMLGVARARHWEDFHAALRGFAVSGLNMVCAGSDGRVGRCMAGHLPRRPLGAPTDLVLPPEAAAAWRDVADSHALPTLLDPEAGFVVSANEAPPEGAFPVGYFFAPGDRASRMAALLGGEAPLGVADLQRLQRDVFMPGSLALRQWLLQHLAAAPRPAAQQQLLDTLAAWDGHYRQGDAGPLAFEALLAATVAALGRRRHVRPYQVVWQTQGLLLEDLQREPPARLQRALAQALPVAARTLARHGTWGAVHRFELKHLLGRVPGASRHCSVPPFAADGGNNTVYKSSHPITGGRHPVSFGSCARHVSDLADPNANHFVLLGGQDGWLGSANFADQLPLWREGRYITVPLQPAVVHQTFPHRMEILPAA